MKTCPHCHKAWNEKHTEASVSGIQIVGCPEIPEGTRYMLAKSTWKPKPREIIDEINALHLDHVKNFGDRRNPVVAYVGDEEVALLDKEASASRYLGNWSTPEGLRAALRSGEVTLYSPCGRLTLYRVDVAQHLALGWVKK